MLFSQHDPCREALGRVAVRGKLVEVQGRDLDGAGVGQGDRPGEEVHGDAALVPLVGGGGDELVIPELGARAIQAGLGCAQGSDQAAVFVVQPSAVGIRAVASDLDPQVEVQALRCVA